MITLTQEVWDLLQKVQQDVNKEPYKTDLQLYHTEEFWTIMNGNGGDCEDYALTKRQNLINAGLDATHLLPAIGLDSNGAGHCVLLVETDKGTYAMDNNLINVVAWDDNRVTIKKWIERADSSGKWVSFN